MPKATVIQEETQPTVQVVIPIPDGPDHSNEIPEEEDEGIELETITYKGTDYY